MDVGRTRTLPKVTSKVTAVCVNWATTPPFSLILLRDCGSRCVRSLDFSVFSFCLLGACRDVRTFGPLANPLRRSTPFLDAYMGDVLAEFSVCVIPRAVDFGARLCFQRAVMTMPLPGNMIRKRDARRSISSSDHRVAADFDRRNLQAPSHRQYNQKDSLLDMAEFDMQTGNPPANGLYRAGLRIWNTVRLRS